MAGLKATKENYELLIIILFIFHKKGYFCINFLVSFLLDINYGV